MRILFLTQYYPPEHGAPQNRLHDLARRWRAAGHEVTVMTAMPSYPKGRVFPEYRGKLVAEEEIDGVRVVRSPIFATRKKGVAPQLASYFSFVFSSLVVGLFKIGRQDWLIWETPPLFLGFTALALALVKRARLVTNISDLWPESAVQLGMLRPGPALSLLRWFERFLYRRSTLVTCQTEGIVAGVAGTGAPTQRELFPNGVDLEMFPPRGTPDKLLAAELGVDADTDFVVGYGGNHGRSQALRQVLDAAELAGERPELRWVKFLLVGDGPEKDELLAYAKDKNLTNVVFADSRPRGQMAAVQNLWSLALVPLRDIEIFNGARPSKMFELMAGGVPFVFCGRGEGADIAAASGCGEVVPPESPSELLEKIAELAAMPKESLASRGIRGRQFVEQNYDRRVLAEKLLARLSEFTT